MKNIVKIIIAMSVGMVGCASSTPAYEPVTVRVESYRVQARVVNAEPINHCVSPQDIQAAQYRKEPRKASTGSVLLGGLIGGVIGNQFGGGDGKKIATAVGAIGGMAMASGGDDDEYSYSSGYYRSGPDVRDYLPRDRYGRSLDVRDGDQYSIRNERYYGGNTYNPYIDNNTLQCTPSGYTATIVYLHPHTQQMVSDRVQLNYIPQENLPSEYNGGQFTPFLISYPVKIRVTNY